MSRDYGALRLWSTVLMFIGILEQKQGLAASALLLPLFTGVRGRNILRSSHQASVNGIML
jgi:hypothetical protein